MRDRSNRIGIAYRAVWTASLALAGCAASAGDNDQASVEQASFGANLGTVVATPVATGGTAGGTNDNRPACSPSSTAPDVAYFWTAPATGTYTFTTVFPPAAAGVLFDTVLEVRNLITGASLGCNDDSAGTLQSTVPVAMTSGQAVRIIVDGFGNASGSYVLSISGDPGANARLYGCGYALPGFACNNGKNSLRVNAVDMTTAVTACHLAQPADRPDFCYVLDSEGAAPTDASECAAVGGSWRPGNSCCNFLGTTSCP